MEAGGAGGPWDLFVSYAAVDVAWAEWIAWQLEGAGLRVLIASWDFVPGTRWMSRTADGVRGSTRVLAVVSAAYLESVYGQQEWEGALLQDPSGFGRKLLPVRIEDCALPGLLGTVVSIDLFGLDEEQARDRLLCLVQAAASGRAKPGKAPDFPGRSRSVVLSVQAIDADPREAEAGYTLDWVHLYDGDQPWVRVQPRDPSGWRTMESDLIATVATLENAGVRSTEIRGAMRQATFFRIGIALPLVRGHTLLWRQGDQMWSTASPKVPVEPPRNVETRLNLGDDLAVTVGMAVDPTAAVVDYLATSGVPVGRLVTITPGGGPDDQSVRTAGMAVAYAALIRDLVRAAVDERPSPDRVHLFLAGPGGLALLLGNRWNCLRPTVVYEHLGAGRGYTPAFTV